MDICRAREMVSVSGGASLVKVVPAPSVAPWPTVTGATNWVSEPILVARTTSRPPALVVAPVTLSPSVMEGFASAKVLVEGLRRAGPKPTREKIAAALAGMNHYDLGGLELGYGPGDRTGLSFVELSIIDADGLFRR